MTFCSLTAWMDSSSTDMNCARYPFSAIGKLRAMSADEEGRYFSFHAPRGNAEALAHHPQRAELALLAAAGYLRSAEPEAHSHAKTLIRQACDAGATQETAARLLIGGVHANLAKSAALAGQSWERVLGHFEQALRMGTPGSDARLLGLQTPWHVVSVDVVREDEAVQIRVEPEAGTSWNWSQCGPSSSSPATAAWSAAPSSRTDHRWLKHPPAVLPFAL